MADDELAPLAGVEAPAAAVEPTALDARGEPRRHEVAALRLRAAQLALDAHGVHADPTVAGRAVVVEGAAVEGAAAGAPGSLHVWAYRDRPVYHCGRDKKPGDIDCDTWGEFNGSRNGFKAFWLRDDAPEATAALAFLDRRLAELARLQRRR